MALVAAFSVTKSTSSGHPLKFGLREILIASWRSSMKKYWLTCLKGCVSGLALRIVWRTPFFLSLATV